MTESTITYTLPWALPPLSGNRVRGNPYAQGAKVAQALQEARTAIRAAGVTPWPGDVPAVVTTHLRVTSWHNRDADNLSATHKVIQDALVQEGVLHKDGFKWVRRAAQEIHGPDGEPGCMWVTVEAA